MPDDGARQWYPLVVSTLPATMPDDGASKRRRLSRRRSPIYEWRSPSFIRCQNIWLMTLGIPRPAKRPLCPISYFLLSSCFNLLRPFSLFLYLLLRRPTIFIAFFFSYFTFFFLLTDIVLLYIPLFFFLFSFSFFFGVFSSFSGIGPRKGHVCINNVHPFYL